MNTQLPRILHLLAVITLTFLLPARVLGAAFDFIAFGDIPYNGEQRDALDRFRQELAIHTRTPAFAVFYGDLKKGSCLPISIR